MSTYRHPWNRKSQSDQYTRPELKEWLTCERVLTYSQQHSRNYWTGLYWTTPPWLSDDQIGAMKAIYKSANSKFDHIDHIVPMNNPLVCGLNVPWNLQKLPKKQNLSKSNHWWDDHPFENLELFPKFEPVQLTL